MEVDDDALKAQVTYIPTGQILKRFTGEFAWADARRFANDKDLTWTSLLMPDWPEGHLSVGSGPAAPDPSTGAAVPAGSSFGSGRATIGSVSSMGAYGRC